MVDNKKEQNKMVKKENKKTKKVYKVKNAFYLGNELKKVGDEIELTDKELVKMLLTVGIIEEV